MDISTTKLLASAILVILAIILRSILVKSIRRITNKYHFHADRKAKIVKFIHFSLIFTTALILLGIWEIKTEDITIYFASIFAVIGVAFFAQWSHLSNITAAIILYFSHPVKIGDKVDVEEGESSVKGIISDIGLFFVTIDVAENKKTLITNTLLLQKMLSVTPREKKENI